MYISSLLYLFLILSIKKFLSSNDLYAGSIRCIDKCMKTICGENHYSVEFEERMYN